MKINLTKRLLKSTAAKLIAAFLMSGTVQESQAVTFLWNNTGSQWTSPTSWTNGVQPSSTSSSTTTDDIQFGNYGANNNTVVLTSTRAAASMVFLANANTYNINNNTSAQILSISKGLTNNSTATQTFGILVENANANNTWTQVTGGSLVFNNNVGLTTASSATSRTLTLAGGGTFTFNSGITQGLSTAGKLSINNSGGVVNLNAANAMGGGIVITAGQVNFNNAQSLGTGIVEFAATTGTSYGNSILNNTKGSAIVLTGVTGVLWSGVSPAGIQIGTSSSTALNNIDFGSGFLTANTSRAMNIAGTGVTISMGTLTTATGTGNGYTYQFDGIGNTIDLDGWKISTAATPTQNVVHQIKGTANVNMGIIENGTAGWINGVEFNSSGITRLTGNNTYTGTTSFLNGTNYISGNNNAATGNITIGGASGSGRMPLVRLDSVNAISSTSSLMGSTSTSTTGTIDFNATRNYTFNSFLGNNMIFTNSYGQVSVVTFTNTVNTITSSAGTSGGRSLLNNSSDLSIVFDGSIDIGSSSTGLNNTLGGIGNWLVKGNIFSTTVGSTRGLNKTGAGLLELRGANNYNGDTVISGGTLLVATNGSITGSASQLSGGTLDVRGTIGSITQSGGTLVVSGIAGTTIINTGSVASTVNSGGTIGSTTINGSLLSVNGNAGDIIVNSGGTLGGSGSVQGLTLNGGTVAPGNSPGLLTAYELNGSNGRFQFQLGAPTTRGTTYDAIDVTTLLTLGASTAFTFETLNSYTYAMGDTYDLFNFNSIDASAFDNAVLLAALPDLDTANSNLKWDVNSFNADGVVNVIPEPSTFSLMFGGLTGLIALKLMRRRNG
jgi:autotransporter-associated beta strand protein